MGHSLGAHRHWRVVHHHLDREVRRSREGSARSKSSGTIELVCGVLLVLGLLTRLAAALLAANLVVAIATAGRVEGGSFHLGVGPAMLLAMLLVFWAGAGLLALDPRLLRRLEGSG